MDTQILPENKPPEEECPICGETHYFPVACTRCGTVFCRQELLDHFRVRRFWCPACRKHVTSEQVNLIKNASAPGAEVAM